MPSLLSLPTTGAGRLLATLLVSGTPGAMAHELTSQAYRNSLAPGEAALLFAAADLRAPAPAPATAADLCQLTLRVFDAQTRQPRPALVRLTSAGGSALPLPGLINRGLGLRQNHPAKEWFVLPAAATVPVPRGRFTLEAFAGLETERVRVSLETTGRTEIQVDLPLTTFSAVARGGWYAGNPHLHLQKLTRAQADSYLRAVPRSDGLDVVFVSYLERMNDDRQYISNEYSLADLERLGGPDLHFGNGQEHRHNFERGGEGYGHVMFLDLPERVPPVSIGAGLTGLGPDWPPLRTGIGRARDQRATVVWCHNRFGHEDVPSWLDGLVDAQNIFDGGSTGSYADTFYRYLNIGLKVPFSAGTDWFIYDFSRVYVRVEGPLTVPSWLAALKAGRTFISNGPLLEFHVGTSQAGDTIRLEQPEILTVSGRATGRHDFQELELIRNGQVVHRAPSRAVEGHFEAELNFRLTLDASSWLALRVTGGSLDSSGAVAVPVQLPVRGSGPKNEMGETPFAHTSPVYVELGGKGIFIPDAARSLVTDLAAALTAILSKAAFDRDTQREEVLQIYRDSIAGLRHRLRE